MNYDYAYGNQFYNYYDNIGIKSVKYQIMAPEQSQAEQPGMEYLMTPRPIFDNPNYKGSGKLKDKVIIITGGDSGLGRAAAIAFVKEGAKVVIPYYNEHRDAEETKKYIEELGGECLLLSGDITKKSFCKNIVKATIEKFGKIDILVNNAGVQYQQDRLESISDEQFDWTMKVNIYGMFYLTREVLPYLKSGDSIINLSSVTTFYGEPQLIDYVTTKGAIVGFTRSLARSLALKKIRVNAIAPGVTTSDMTGFKSDENLYVSYNANERVYLPEEVAEVACFLLSDVSKCLSGQILVCNESKSVNAHWR